MRERHGGNTNNKRRPHPIGDRLVRDVGGAFAAGLGYIGDRLGLFRAVATLGSATSEQVAQQTALNERYVREWLNGMVAAEYIEYDAATQRYSMTDEQREVLVDEDSPVFAAGAFQFTIPTLLHTQRILEAFRNGGGISFADFGAEVSEGIDRLHRAAFEHRLVATWFSSVPGLASELAAGMSVLDVGCGIGRSTVEVGAAYPASRIVGVDPDAYSIQRARLLATERGALNVEFVQGRVADLPESPVWDLVLAFDCIHDMVDPVAVLTDIRARMARGGKFLWAEPTGSDNPLENRTPLAKMRANLSPFHCLAVSLAHGGAGLGTIIGVAGARRLAEAAGFSSFTELNVDDSQQQFFLLQA